MGGRRAVSERGGEEAAIAQAGPLPRLQEIEEIVAGGPAAETAGDVAMAGLADIDEMGKVFSHAPDDGFLVPLDEVFQRVEAFAHMAGEVIDRRRARRVGAF